VLIPYIFYGYTPWTGINICKSLWAKVTSVRYEVVGLQFGLILCLRDQLNNKAKGLKSMDIQSSGCTLWKETILENETQIQSKPELQKINNLKMPILPFILYGCEI
jgi:hypothetical protein